MAEISFDQVTKVYPDGTEAVRSVDLGINDGTLMVLVGPSGCGKTTMLRMVAGLEEITDGTIRIGDRVVNDIDAKNRDLAMVFQNYALYPHMSCYDNMAFGLKLRKMPRKEIDRRVRETARTLGLEDQLKKKPGALSGGQRQRVAMGRAIVREPKAFLMDEPLSNLDAKLRVQMRTEISRIQRDLGVTMIYVTHDQTEAMTMGDSVAVMNRGVLQQVDTPQDMYDNPSNLFVAGFIGSPAMNMVEATLARRDGGAFAEFGGMSLRIPDETFGVRRSLADYAGKPIVLGIRPEEMEDPQFVPSPDADAQIPVMVDHREAMGSEVYAHFTVDAPPVITDDTRDLAADTGVEVLEELVEDSGRRSTAFVARLHPRTSAVRGRPMNLHVDTRSLHFFDRDTSQAIR
ncbi:MAG TPA: sn-glycerol-3-phosphate ABC transporter ATP-binding protein UgpC [Gaiellales bacterium]|jgi:multiple sugar transport system ATP-binding protein|nr:sn-glycerol-3-phosphate ABC transporter ATP-binding protein UgpC [Gaiellales bacterium]